MSIPAAYPATDDSENRAVTILENTLSPRAKADIKTRDKVPNYDGTIELVDDHRLPIGKLDVQVKAIPKGQTKYSCPTALVAYSERTSVPFILICVDLHSERIYWKHLYTNMPGYKPNQKTFTLYFDSSYETIDETELYLQQWGRLTQDFLERIAEYPQLKSKYSLEQELKDIDEKELQWYQKYIDAFNQVFDVQFQSLKKIILPGTWKLGLGIGLVRPSWFTYRIHRIAYGAPAPMIVKLHPDEYSGDRFAIPGGDSIRAGGRSTDFVIAAQDPDMEGKQDALEFVKEAIKARPYKIIGKGVSSEQIFHFTDDFWFGLDIKQSDEYQLDKLLYGYYRYFPYWCHVARGYLTRRTPKNLNWDSRQWARDPELLRKIAAEVERQIASRQPIPATLVTSSRYNFRHLEDSLKYLKSKDAMAIRRPLFRHPRGLTKFDSFDEVVWRNRIEAILTNAINEYEEFLVDNDIMLPESSKFMVESSILFAYEFHSIGDTIEPRVARYILSNKNGTLPRVIVVKHNEVTESNDTQLIAGLYLDSLVWRGKTYQIKHPMSRPFHEIFSETPILDHVYSMLWEDLKID